MQDVTMQKIGKLIHIVDIKLKRRIDRLADEFDLTSVQFFVMEWIYFAAKERGDVFQRDLEAALDVRRSTISNMLKLLEAKGYVLRESVSEDARLKKLVLTSDGIRIYKEFKEHLSTMAAEESQFFSQEEMDMLVSLLKRLTKVIKD